MSAVSSSTKGKENTRSLLIETGIDIMLQKGFNNTGLSEVLSVCKVPKGSFYYYFTSKEDFGLQIINTFDEKYAVELDRILGDDTLSPLARLKAYIDDAISKAEQRQCSRGCLIANLSQEMADQNELFRNRLSEILESRRKRISDLIEKAQSSKEIITTVNATDAAEFFLSAFEGALMRSKVRKTTEPLQIFRTMVFEHLLR